MPNNKKIFPCPNCGKIGHKDANEDPCELAAVGDRLLSRPIHRNRLEAENLVPASELEAVVKVLKMWRKLDRKRLIGPTQEADDFCMVETIVSTTKALAHAKTILGGKR